ncbi:MAG: aldehyde ferredoxin oxidoreductase family protein [Candidatus Bathyarchaeota archaeon]|nr:aldehyde ferredoxin oxidoreductase family protein [Candidatus Bathyarchaeota archaeon]MDH5531996.1 aldehyde ferredoxin oxidoreductase family protein [Candidatus Bathyarchaeota archaeon]MDH5712961.1 aldehyde ferredoxin oxidoreductase family protein [Candidatus Bathyarchaeota archaeon]
MSYTKRILHVDLETGKTEIEPLKEEMAKKYIGGIGLGMRLFLDNSKPGVDPFNPKNPIIFATGPLSGTMAPSAGNGYAVVSKSPLTGIIAESKAHGFFGAELKRAGYDAVIFTGKSEKLVYAWIDDDSVQLMDAQHLKGKSPHDTEKAIREELGDFYIRVSAIGEAGEKLVRIASIINDEFRAIGRTGMGAVMGSKNLKAVAVRGTNDVNVANPEEFTEFIRIIHERMKGPATRKYRTLGTPENVLVLNAIAALPTRNFTQATFEGAEKVSGEYLNERYIKKIIGCATCGMRCDHIGVVPEGPYKGATARVEFECLWALGPNTGVDRLDAIIEAIYQCDYYGMDGISAGVIVSFAMDCYENGILTKKDTEGLDLRFGNAEALVETIKRMGSRKGWLGDVLAEGSMRAAEKIGKGAVKYANHIKGLELPGYELRTLKTAALGFSVSFRGACHLRSGAYSPDVKGKVDRFKIEKGRGKIVMDGEDVYNVVDSLILCKFSRGVFYEGLNEMAKYYTLATGIEMTAEELGKAGERINNLARVINIREGKGTREYDTLPPKIMSVPVPDEGVAKGAYVNQKEFDIGLDDYYEVRGWTKQGIPTVEKLKELGMSDLVPIVKKKIGSQTPKKKRKGGK